MFVMKKKKGRRLNVLIHIHMLNYIQLLIFILAYAESRDLHPFVDTRVHLSYH
jgi:hypothetical protein